MVEGPGTGGQRVVGYTSSIFCGFFLVRGHCLGALLVLVPFSPGCIFFVRSFGRLIFIISRIGIFLIRI